MKTRRANALKTFCPKCGVGAHVACRRSDGTARRSVHMNRIQQAAKGLSPVKAEPVGFYASDAWRRVRYQALKLHGGRCQCCGASPTAGKSLHVDHILPRSKHPLLELQIDNLQVLCEACNLGKSNRDDTDWRGRR